MDNRHALSIQQSATLLQERYGVRVSPTTLSHWLDEYKAFCTYARMREKGTALFPPHQLIQATRLHHQQVYHYRLHRAKLALLLAEREHRTFTAGSVVNLIAGPARRAHSRPADHFFI